MKITPTQYAKSLYEATKDKEHSEINVAVSNFLNVLSKNNQWKFKNNIIKKFAEIYNADNKIVEAEVISREEMSQELLNKLRNYVSNKYKAKEVIIKSKVDQNIQGGIIIRVGDEVMDASVGRQLSELRNKLAV